LDESIFSLLIGPPEEVTNIPAQISARGHRTSPFFRNKLVQGQTDLIPPRRSLMEKFSGHRASPFFRNELVRPRPTSFPQHTRPHPSPNISSRSSGESIFRNELVRLLDESIFSLLIGPPEEVANIPAQISARGHQTSPFSEMNSSKDRLTSSPRPTFQPKYQLAVIGRVHFSK